MKEPLQRLLCEVSRRAEDTTAGGKFKMHIVHHDAPFVAMRSDATGGAHLAAARGHPTGEVPYLKHWAIVWGLPPPRFRYAKFATRTEGVVALSKVSVDRALGFIGDDVAALLASPSVSLGMANPPNVPGVYMLLVDDEIVYVGEAKGSKGLGDRLLSKHMSGDDNHAIQRAFKPDFPDRGLRRDHIKRTVSARWLSIADTARVSTVERFLIWLYEPAWNKK